MYDVEGTVWTHMSAEYTVTGTLGKGSYGEVAQAVCKLTGELVAIKYINDLGDCEYDWVKLIREIQIMDGLGDNPKNNFLVKIIDLKMIEQNDG